jgi:ribulose-5-phosphate 4-epimerase/fuculose-1-phosphate aldolase
VHPRYATVVASLEDSSILPIDQNTMRFYERVALDDSYGGMGFEEESERLVSALGDKSILMMGNHGVMVTGPTVAQAFDELYYLERACDTLVHAYMTGKELRVASPEVAQRTCREWLEYPEFAEGHFKELKAILDEEEPSYRD